MLLTLTYTQSPATDLGYLLHKHPARLQTFELSFGKAHVFYPEATTERCTAALLLDIDPVGLVRGRPDAKGEGGPLEQYVNDRPYVASSFLSVAIAQVFGSALGGKAKTKAELVETALPLQAKLWAVPCRGGESVLHRLFEPLGYIVKAQGSVLDKSEPEWGNSSYYNVTLEAKCRLSELLSHLYVLIPVLDDDKHYWIGEDEVEKLLRFGEGWLSQHPERNLITSRYLKKRRNLVQVALSRLLEEEEPGQERENSEMGQASGEAAIEQPLSLNEQRMTAVVTALKQSRAKRVLDLGCGEGKLLKLLLEDNSFEEIVGLDVSYRTLEYARERLHLERLPDRQQARIKLIQGSLTYRDSRIAGYDAATVVEVIEHLDLPRLSAFERVLFEFARPGTVIITTPNFEYNVRFANLPADKLRHKDHRFEWTRPQFAAWANTAAQRFGYEVRFEPIGPEDPEVGPPTQMAVFVATRL